MKHLKLLAITLCMGLAFQACQKDTAMSVDSPRSESAVVADHDKTENSVESILKVLKASRPELLRVAMNAPSAGREDVAFSEKLVQNLYRETINTLSVFGLSVSDIAEIEKTYNQEDIAVFGLVFVEAYHQRGRETELRSSVLGCLAHAVGMDILHSLGAEITWAGLKRVLSSPAGKRFAMSVISKVGARALGPIGLAVAAYDFIDCMND